MTTISAAIPRILVAGVGNIFLGDDGFGVEVARRLGAEQLPDGVQVADFGIRGVHLAYELLDGYDALVLIDATARGGEPGSLYLFEPDLNSEQPDPDAMGAHDMSPEVVLRLLSSLGGRVGRTLIVGCEPEHITEKIGLSRTVEQSIDTAMLTVRELVDELRQEIDAWPPAAAVPSEGGAR